jgi:hypothetical protein
VIRVRPEVEACAGLPAQRRGETADEVLRLDERDLLAVLREREARGEAADATADDDRVGQGETSEISRGLRG